MPNDWRIQRWKTMICILLPQICGYKFMPCWPIMIMTSPQACIPTKGTDQLPEVSNCQCKLPCFLIFSSLAKSLITLRASVLDIGVQVTSLLPSSRERVEAEAAPERQISGRRPASDSFAKTVLSQIPSTSYSSSLAASNFEFRHVLVHSWVATFL